MRVYCVLIVFKMYLKMKQQNLISLNITTPRNIQINIIFIPFVILLLTLFYMVFIFIYFYF